MASITVTITSHDASVSDEILHKLCKILRDTEAWQVFGEIPETEGLRMYVLVDGNESGW